MKTCDHCNRPVEIIHIKTGPPPLFETTTTPVYTKESHPHIEAWCECSVLFKAGLTDDPKATHVWLDP